MQRIYDELTRIGRVDVELADNHHLNHVPVRSIVVVDAAVLLWLLVECSSISRLELNSKGTNAILISVGENRGNVDQMLNISKIKCFTSTFVWKFSKLTFGRWLCYMLCLCLNNNSTHSQVLQRFLDVRFDFCANHNQAIVKQIDHLLQNEFREFGQRNWKRENSSILLKYNLLLCSRFNILTGNQHFFCTEKIKIREFLSTHRRFCLLI